MTDSRGPAAPAPLDPLAEILLEEAMSGELFRGLGLESRKRLAARLARELRARGVTVAARGGAGSPEPLRVVLLRLWESGFTHEGMHPPTWTTRDAIIDAALQDALRAVQAERPREPSDDTLRHAIQGAWDEYWAGRILKSPPDFISLAVTRLLVALQGANQETK